MTANIEEISREIVELPKHQQLALLKLLLDLDRSHADQGTEGAWDEEIRARVKAVDEGRAVGIPYEQVREDMARRFPS